MFFQSHKVWSRLESFVKEKYPPCIKRVLIFSAYTTEISLLELDESKLELLESHINENRQVLSDLNCCFSDDYKNQSQFHFLPGHRATILGIKNQVIAMKESRSRGSKSKSKPIKTGDELKEMLIKSLDMYATKKGLPANTISESNIVGFEEKLVDGNKIYRCGFSCLFCSKVIPTLYKTYWMTSNATKHLKVHLDEGSTVEIEYIE